MKKYGGYQTAAKSPTGVQKYDLLTALACWGYSQSSTVTNSVFRLIGLITARYNWARNEVAVGRAWLAQFWDCNESTVKREIKRLTDLGLIFRKSHGVRGRVSRYGVGLQNIRKLTEPVWANVGPDFAQRMRETNSSETDGLRSETDAPVGVGRSSGEGRRSGIATRKQAVETEWRARCLDRILAFIESQSEDRQRDERLRFGEKLRDPVEMDQFTRYGWGSEVLAWKVHEHWIGRIPGGLPSMRDVAAERVRQAADASISVEDGPVRREMAGIDT